MPARKGDSGLTESLGAIKVTPKLKGAIEGVRRLLSDEAGYEVSTAEAMRRLMLRGLAATPEAPPLSPAVDGALGS